LMFALRGIVVTSAQDRAQHSSPPRKLDGGAIFFWQHAIGLTIAFPIAVAVAPPACVTYVFSANALAGGALSYLLLSSTAFFAYNRLSLTVLLMLNAVAHSVLNALRRAVTIGTAAFVFTMPLSPLAATGILMIIAASASYAYSADADSRAAAISRYLAATEETTCILLASDEECSKPARAMGRTEAIGTAKSLEAR